MACCREYLVIVVFLVGLYGIQCEDSETLRFHPESLPIEHSRRPDLPEGVDFKEKRNQSVDDLCKNESYWGEASTCDVEKTGINMSIGWCPISIQNNSINSHIYFRLNRYSVTKTLAKAIDEGNATVSVEIPGFNATIFKRDFHYSCKELKDYLPPLMAVFISCPFTFPTDLPPGLLKNKLNITNPLPTILPAGSYHFTVNVTNSKQQYAFCINPWLEFGV